MSRAWISNAVRVIEADFNRSADTHLIPLPLPALPGVQVYLKDESSHPTGSLKHRLARSLFLYALANGWIREGTTIVEASSGSTAISEAYFARLLGLPFVAVMPRATSPEKVAAIFSGDVVAGITATKGRPSSRAKYASETAVEPDDDSITVLFSCSQPLHSEYRKRDRARRCLRLPVGWLDSSFR